MHTNVSLFKYECCTLIFPNKWLNKNTVLTQLYNNIKASINGRRRLNVKMVQTTRQQINLIQIFA